MTSGPTDPGIIGRSSDLPSGSLRVAFFSMAFPLGGAKTRHDLLETGFVLLAATAHDIPEIVVREVQESRKLLICRVFLQISFKDDVQLEQAAPALPPQPVGGPVHQTARLTIISLILLIALVGLRFFGQTSTQFMMVWQRNSRYGSSRLSSRSEVA